MGEFRQVCNPGTTHPGKKAPNRDQASKEGVFDCACYVFVDYLACLQIVTHPDTVRFPGFRPDGDGERRDDHSERDDAYMTYIRL